jgi:hypothetical protein
VHERQVTHTLRPQFYQSGEGSTLSGSPYNVEMDNEKEEDLLQMNNGLSRRSLGALFAFAPFNLALQSPSSSTTGTTQPSTTENPNKAAANVKGISDQLSQIEVPMNIEPAFSFHP